MLWVYGLYNCVNSFSVVTAGIRQNDVNIRQIVTSKVGAPAESRNVGPLSQTFF